MEERYIGHVKHVLFIDTFLHLFGGGGFIIQIRQSDRGESEWNNIVGSLSSFSSHLNTSCIWKPHLWSCDQGSNCVIASFYQAACFLAWAIFHSNLSHQITAPLSTTRPRITMAAGNPYVITKMISSTKLHELVAKQGQKIYVVPAACHAKRSSNIRSLL